MTVFTLYTSSLVAVIDFDLFEPVLFHFETVQNFVEFWRKETWSKISNGILNERMHLLFYFTEKQTGDIRIFKEHRQPDLLIGRA